MALRAELRDPWGILAGGVAAGLGWAVGIPLAAAAGIGAAVWVVRATGEALRGPGAPAASEGFDPDLIMRQLALLRRRIARRVPEDVVRLVAAISETIESILPRARSLGAGSQELFVLTRTATDYLPTALEAYVNLPRGYATKHPIRGGRTAHEVLVEQLTLLRTQMEEIAVAVNRNDTDKLLAHGRFLEERFGVKGLSIEPQDGEGGSV